MSQTGPSNGSLPRWVESLDRRLEQGLGSCSDGIAKLRDHVEASHRQLSDEIRTLREDGSAERKELYQRLDTMAEAMGERVGELEQWRATKEVPHPGSSLDWRSFLRTPWPWLFLLAALIIPGAIGQLIDLIEAIRGA